jgi:hypothetical protein
MGIYTPRLQSNGQKDDKVAALNVEESMNAEACDLADLMSQWAKGEAKIFRDASCQKLLAHSAAQEEGTPPSLTTPALWRSRRLVAKLLQRVLLEYDAGDELPSALALFDAYCLTSSVQETALQATTTAVARLCLKVGTAVSIEDLDCQQFFQDETEFPESLVLEIESRVISSLSGRIRPTSPHQWADIVVERMRLLGTQKTALEQAVPHIKSWALLLSESMPSTAYIPPKAAGLAACIMGLISAGAMCAEEVRPCWLGDEAWQATVFMQLAASARNMDHQQKVEIDLGLVTQAACCDTDGLLSEAFNVATEFQRIVADSGAGGAETTGLEREAT